MKFNYKDQKVIEDFKEYIEKLYLDFINEEIIDEYILATYKSNQEKEILKKRFLEAVSFHFRKGEKKNEI